MNNARLNLVTAPASEPVTTTEVKDFIRETGSDLDSQIASLIVSAREKAELYTGRAFITQTYQAFYDEWPENEHVTRKGFGYTQRPISSLYGGTRVITLPKSPLISVTHIKTYSDDNTATTYSEDNYTVQTYSGINPSAGRIILKDIGTPPTFTRNGDGVEIQFVAGYGGASDVPQQIKQAIVLEVQQLLDNTADCDLSCMCSASQGLLLPYKMSVK